MEPIDIPNALDLSNTPRDVLSRKFPFIFNDFLAPTSTTVSPFLCTLIASGTVATGTSGEFDKNHPGVIRLASSTSANSGVHIGAGTSNMLLGGGEEAVFIWRPSTFTNTTSRIGFHDANTSSDAVDGCYFEVDSSGVVVGKTANNSTRSTTASSHQLMAATWYKFRVTLDPTAASVKFEITDDTGKVLWTDTLTTNIPTATGRECGIGFISTNSGTSATGLSSIDFMSFACRRQLSRGK